MIFNGEMTTFGIKTERNINRSWQQGIFVCERVIDITSE